MRTIQKKMGFKCVSSVADYLVRIKKKGFSLKHLHIISVLAHVWMIDCVIAEQAAKDLGLSDKEIKLIEEIGNGKASENLVRIFN